VHEPAIAKRIFVRISKFQTQTKLKGVLQANCTHLHQRCKRSYASELVEHIHESGVSFSRCIKLHNPDASAISIQERPPDIRSQPVTDDSTDLVVAILRCLRQKRKATCELIFEENCRKRHCEFVRGFRSTITVFCILG